MSEARNAALLFRRRVHASGGRTALRYKEREGGAWRTLSWQDWDAASREIAAGLRERGVAPGDRVCLVAGTRVEWVLADVGIVMAGAVTVPIYQSNTAEQCEYIVADSGAKVVIAEDPYQLEKLAGHAAPLTVVLMAPVAQLERPDARGRISVALADVPAGKHTVITLADLRAAGQAWLLAHPGQLEREWDAIQPDHVFTIVYTSGTTGPPKGVVLTHKNLAFECAAVSGLLHVGEDDEQLLFLPLAHIFAKILEWTSIENGSAIAFAEGIPKLIDNMKEVRPTFMGSVPRVYEKAYVKIQASFAEKRKKAVAGRLIDWALGVGRRCSQERQAGRTPTGLLAVQHRLADKLVFAKVKQTFGGRLRFFVSGGAPLAREIGEFFHAAGILILEGYGLTETTAATHINRADAFRFGTVGQALPGVEVRIAEDGEVLARGANILREYHGKPDATREAIDGAGWFHTGDIGVIEEGGFLRITDRKKDIIVTAGGKNVAPQNLENALKALCPYVSQVMVHGDKRNFLTALVTLAEENVVAWARARGLAHASAADLAAAPEVRALVEDAVDRLNAGLASYETIKKFAILPHDLSQEAGELTPTLKVKRKFVGEKYRHVLDGFYAEAAAGAA